MYKVNKKIIFFTTALVFFLRASFTFALEVPLPGLGNTPSFPEYVCYFFGYGINLAAIIGMLAIAIGGIYYLIDYSRGRFKDEGKNWVKAGILGFLITISSYSIAYTINPELTSCKMGVLTPLTFLLPTSSPKVSTVPKATYNEIPIGTLTETLLTRTMDCYGFDQEGNPVDGISIDSTLARPTYLNNDRADCLLQLLDGAQKKGHLISTLSEDIMKLMDTCSCLGKCPPTCGGQSDCTLVLTNKQITGVTIDGGKDECSGGCTQPCVKAPCKMPDPLPTPPDCCPAQALDPNTLPTTQTPLIDPKTGKNITNPLTGKDLTVKEQIEHGPINVNVETNAGTGSKSCKTETRIFAGLDEFRSTKTYSEIKHDVETTRDINGRTVTIIKTGNCGICINNCQDCDEDTMTPPIYAKCLTDKKKCEDAFTACQDNKNKCQKGSPWYNLKLIDQLTYINGKIGELKSEIKADEDVLKTATTTLGECYLAIPYIDLLKTEKITSNKVLEISTNKLFSDPKTNTPISVAKYCQGFNYKNSSCLKKCNDMCPDNSQEALTLYAKCSGIAAATGSGLTCDYDDCPIGDICDDASKKCINADKQEQCIEDAYNKRPCKNAPSDGPKIFSECISSCQNSCSDTCAKKYLNCSDEYIFCNSQCNNNSKCVLTDNAGSCLFGASNLIECTNQPTDQGNTNNCINNAYKCKNGSSEYAGYQECIDTTVSGCSADKFSSSYFYEADNKKCQKCPNPYVSPSPGSACYSSTVKTGTSCQELCPETTKCPTSSDCPFCPCDQLSDPNDPTKPLSIDFSLPDSITKSGISKYVSTTKEVSGHQIVGPQCNNYSYNDDPLTFYCRSGWATDKSKEGTGDIPIGAEKKCNKEGEVPVGQTVDDAIKWADDLIASANKMNGFITGMITQMKKAGQAINQSNGVEKYCMCTAKFDNSKPI